MIEYADEALFLQDGVGKQLEIAYSGGVITNNELASEDFVLTEKLTSNGSFVLGECNAGVIEFSVGYGTEPLEGEELTVTITPSGGEPFQIGIYTVVSDKPTADRRWRKITAYDAMYRIINADVTAWYETIFPDAETAHTIKEIRDSFFAYMGITQKATTLPNDSVSIKKQMDFKQLTGKTVVNAICEINGCFGRIDRAGTFVYTFLKAPSNPFYPSYTLFPADDLYPKRSGGSTEIGWQRRYKYPLPRLLYPQNGLFPGEVLYPIAYETIKVDGTYISAKYEDYFVLQNTGVQIRTDQNDIGITVGSGQTYVIQANFLAYGLDAPTLTGIANNILSQINEVYFCPSDIVGQGNPCLEIGDGVVLKTKFATIETIILQRKLKGIQSLIDTYTSKGAKETKKNLNSTQSQIINANGRINEVKADVITAQRAVIDFIETNYLDAEEIAADYATITSLNTVDGKIDNLTAIAITTQNLSAQSINASQINAGTISVTYLDVAGIVSSLSVQSVTVAGLSVTGSATLGGYATFWQYDADLGQYVLCGSPE